jgi:two-component system sensor histidine kinase KdpD
MNSLQKKRGKLKIFLGAAAGVGKTFEMLSQGRQQQRQGRRVLVGIVETHGRIETESLLQGFEILPRRRISHRGIEVTELDLDQVLQCAVDLVLVDELAHTNAAGCRHEKRYQDVVEILDAGFDVYTTLNVQHIESRKELVEKIVGVTVGETVPDRILDLADSIELIDLPPQILIQRLEQGKVYDTEKVAIAKENFFKESTLTALRELALRLTAERVDHELNTYRREKGILKPHKTNERLLVAIGPNPSSESLVRRGRQLAYNLEATFIAVYVDRGMILSPEDQAAVEKNIQLATALGAKVFKISDSDVARAIMRISQDQQITQVIMGKPRKGIKGLYSSGEGLMKDLLENLSDVSLHLVETEASKRARFRSFLFDGNHSSFSDYLKAVLVSIGVVIVAYPFQEWVGYSAIGLFFLSVVKAFSSKPSLFSLGHSDTFISYLSQALFHVAQPQI